MDYKEVMKYTKNCKILYAEDDIAAAETIGEFFHLMFKEVVMVENGEEALHKAQNEEFDIIILDIEMPVMNGLESAKAIKALKPDQNIVFFTAYDTEEFIHAAMIDVGAEAYLTKPFKEEEFSRKILSIIKRQV